MHIQALLQIGSRSPKIMFYTAQQPGGLTDLQFQTDPSESFRNRNWFEVDWNLAALHYDHERTRPQKIRTRYSLRSQLPTQSSVLISRPDPNRRG